MRAMIPFCLLLAMKAWSLPQDLTVKEGKADLSLGKDALQVIASDRSILNWKHFSIGSNERVEFILPSSQSAMLNRVTGGSRSELLGLLQSNGQIYLLNPAGVIIGKDAVIDTAAFTYSTLDIKDSDFLEGVFHFTGESDGTISHLGTIQAREGNVHLFARKYEGDGSVKALEGNIEIAAGTDILLKTDQNSLLSVKPDLKGFSVEPSGKLEALNVYLQSDSAYDLAVNTAAQIQLVREGGKVLIRSGGGKIQLDGRIAAPEGSITVHIPEGDAPLFQSAALAAQSVNIEAPRVIQNGSIQSEEISIRAERYMETKFSKLSADGAVEGGRIEIDADYLFTSGQHSAQGLKGGSIHLLGDEVKIAAADINASGSNTGGEILIGGDAHGKTPEIRNARTVFINSSSQILAQGEKGKIVVWSDEKTSNHGFIKAGEKAFVEVSGKELTQSGKIEAPNGTILLDPANIVIDDVTGTYPHYALVNPSPDTGFGNITLPLSNKNVVVTNRNDSTGGGFAGAVFLFDSVTGSLISTLVGLPGNSIPSSITALTGSSNFLVGSPSFSVGGALTWVNGATGLNGVISAANSLIGTSSGDGIGGNYSLLTNGSYVSIAPFWDDGATQNVGAITWGSPDGISGTVSVANSLIGSNASDQVGITGVAIALTNGAFIVGSPGWFGNRGAVSWGSGTSPVTGTVSAANSLIGTTAGDQIGNISYALTNGNYLTMSAFWDNGGDVNAGAATWGNGATGTFGTVSTANSLYGNAGDAIGREGSVLTNGNYVVKSFFGNLGAVTWGDGENGTVGLVSSANSLVGTTIGDGLGNFGSVYPLSNGNYVAVAPNWDNPVTMETNVGSATWCNGLGGTVGTISAANSLIGSQDSDQVASLGVLVLTNGNYVVLSPNFSDGGTYFGAATWGNGTTGTSGIVSESNSLVGINSGDSISGNGGLALTNGNYLIVSQAWDGGRGAVTWGNGTTGTSGVVDGTNSLVGTTANDAVGTRVVALSQGNYVVGSQNWDNTEVMPTTTNAGAATWGNGSSGISGTITSANSLVGTGMNNSISSSGIEALTDGNYVVRSSGWDYPGTPGPAVNNVGAATWGNGSTGITGTVSRSNSLTGSSANDGVGNGTGCVLANGGYIVQSGNWDDGAMTNAGAATYFPSGRGVVGTVTVQNSVTGPSGAAGLITPQDISADNTFLVNFQSVGAVYIALENPNQLTAERAEGDTLTIPSSFILDALNYGANANLVATDTITISSPITVSPVTSAGSLSLTANIIEIEADITQVQQGGITIRGEDSFTISDGAAITTQNGDILLYSNQSLVAEGGGNIESFGSGNVTLVAENGAFQIHDPFTINVGSGYLSFYAVNPSSANLPSVINGAPYHQFGPFNFLSFGISFPDGNPSRPFSVFYREPFTEIYGLFDYYSSLSEAYYKWTVQFFGPYLDWDPFPPYETPKGLNFYLPSLIKVDLDHPPEDFIYEK